jgi:hemolysin activation/secretion protein
VGLPSKAEFFPLGGDERFRGYSIADRQGSAVWLGSVEWRVPLARGLSWDCLDHIMGVRNLYLAAFYDVGNAYIRGEPVGDLGHALGAGIRADVAWFSFIDRTILRLDFAKALNDATPIQVWVGIQHPF